MATFLSRNVAIREPHKQSLHLRYCQICEGLGIFPASIETVNMLIPRKIDPKKYKSLARRLTL